MIIDHVVNIDHPEFINDIIPKSNNIFKIIDILSKEIYYREEIIKKFKKIGKREYLREPISIVKSLEVFTKEDFFIILNKKSCINFFLLNCLKFDYTKEEKENLKEIFHDYYFIDSQLSIENIIEIREKSSLFNIFPEIYKKNGFDKNNFNFFVKNIKNIKDEELKCSIVFNFFFGFLNYEKKLNNELYLDFFEENTDLIKIFETYIEKVIKNGYFQGRSYRMSTSELEYSRGFAEKLIFEKQMKDF